MGEQTVRDFPNILVRMEKVGSFVPGFLLKMVLFYDPTNRANRMSVMTIKKEEKRKIGWAIVVGQ